MSRIAFRPATATHPAVALFKVERNGCYPHMLIVGNCVLNDQDGYVLDRTEPYDITYYFHLREANKAYNKA